MVGLGACCVFITSNPVLAFENEDSVQKSALKQQESKASLDWFRSAQLGAFMHFLPGTPEQFAMVEQFDVAALAKQLESMGARYFVFTLQQNSGYINSPNATYDRYVGLKPGEKCSTRDLPLELYNMLNPMGIKLMLYIPAQVPNRDKAAQKAFGLVQGPADQVIDHEFAVKWGEVLQEWSDRYGEKVAGWWMDGCYARVHFDEEIAATYAKALKHGNPDVIVAFNPGVKSPVISAAKAEDYTAGELNNPFVEIPESRWLKGKQWHALTFMGSYWGARDVRKPDAEWIKWAKAVAAKEGVISLDMGVNWNPQEGPIGTFSPEQVKQFKVIREALDEMK